MLSAVRLAARCAGCSGVTGDWCKSREELLLVEGRHAPKGRNWSRGRRQGTDIRFQSKQQVEGSRGEVQAFRLRSSREGCSRTA
jgi:hypothetical protein